RLLAAASRAPVQLVNRSRKHPAVQAAVCDLRRRSNEAVSPSAWGQRYSEETRTHGVPSPSHRRRRASPRHRARQKAELRSPAYSTGRRGERRPVRLLRSLHAYCADYSTLIEYGGSTPFSTASVQVSPKKLPAPPPWLPWRRHP